MLEIGGQALLEGMGAAKALEPILGTRARVSEILNGQRKLTLAMIRALHRELHIPLETLVAEPVAKRPARRSRAA